MRRQPKGAKRIVRQRPKPNQKENSPSTKDNLQTGGSAEQVDLESYLRSWEHNGEIQQPPKTRSLSEDHPERRRQWLQGTKRSLRQRLEPHPAGSRVRLQGQPQTRSKGRGGEHVTITWDSEEHWRELRTTEAHVHS